MQPSTLELAKQQHQECEKIAARVIPKVHDYVQWFRSEARAGDPDATMQTVITHTQSWAQANLICAELDALTRVGATTHRHGLKSHKLMSEAELEVLKRIAVAKMLKEIYGGGGSSQPASGFGFVAGASEDN